MHHCCPDGIDPRSPHLRDFCPPECQGSVKAIGQECQAGTDIRSPRRSQ